MLYDYAIYKLDLIMFWIIHSEANLSEKDETESKSLSLTLGKPEREGRDRNQKPKPNFRQT